MPTTAFISRRVVFADEVRPACILADTTSGKITHVTEADAPPSADHTIDCGDDVLLPGLIDPHVHLNEPGRTEWEGFATGTRAAAAGGITTLVDMPLNCLPETTTVEALEIKRRAAAGQSLVDWRPWGGAVNGNQSHLLPLAAAGVPGYKCFLLYPGCDGLGPIDEQDLRAAMPLITQSGLPILVHAELAAPCEAAAQTLADADWTQYSTWLASRPDEAEVAAIALLIRLCREFRTRIHIVHLSSAEALPLLRAARADGLPITVETCPHFLTFAAEDIPARSTLHKCAPPIRSRANREQLWAALKDGIIDLIASDHSPCPPAMKHLEEGSFLTAWGGIASLSLSLPITWTAASTRGFALTAISRWMSSAPAQLAGLAHRKGRIAAGFDADLVRFSPEAAFTVTPQDLHFRHPVTPYLGRTLTGIVRETWLRGHLIYRDGSFPPAPIGLEVRP